MFNIVKRKVKANCGHIMNNGKIKIYDHTIKINPFTSRNKRFGKYELCSNCMAKRDVIKCPYCGKLIIPGNNIILYSLNKEFKINGGIEYNKEFNSMIGCSDPTCAIAGVVHWGYLGFNKKIYKFPNIIGPSVVYSYDE